MILQSGTVSSAGNEALPASATTRLDGDPVTAAVVKVEPGTEGNSADALGCSSASNSTAGPAAALSPGSKDAKGNSSSALHWLADLATQKAKDDSKGDLLCAKTLFQFCLCLWDVFIHLWVARYNYYTILDQIEHYTNTHKSVTSIVSIIPGLSFKTRAPSGP